MARPDSDGPLIHLATRCGSVEEFVKRFAPFASDGALVLPASDDVAVGREGRFVIRLADSSVVMRGRCRVAEVKRADRAAGARTLMRVRLLDMDEPTRDVHRRLVGAARAAAPPAPAVPSTVAAAKVPPPPIATATTMIGVAPKPARPRVATAPAGSPRSFGEEPPLTSGAPAPLPVESRAPGAAFTLPANPLSALAADDLASFIECTLFENEGEATPPAAPEPSGPAVAPPPAPSLRPDPAQAPAPLPTPPPAPALAATPAPVPPVPVPPLRRALAQAAPYALCTVVGVIVGGIWRAPSSRAVAPAAAVVAAPPAVAAPVDPPPPPGPAPAASAPAAAIEPPAADAPAAPAPSHACQATISSDPDGARVFWAGRALGTTPLRAARVPCGEATVTLRHERYRPATQKVTVQPDAPAAISERLRRPLGTLVVSSSPARAIVTVNDQPVGAAPRKLSVWRFERVRVQASLPGYQPWTRTIYLREPITKVNVQLAGSGSAARGDARGGARGALAR